MKIGLDKTSQNMYGFDFHLLLTVDVEYYFEAILPSSI